MIVSRMLCFFFHCTAGTVWSQSKRKRFKRMYPYFFFLRVQTNILSRVCQPARRLPVTYETAYDNKTTKTSQAELMPSSTFSTTDPGAGRGFSCSANYLPVVSVITPVCRLWTTSEPRRLHSGFHVNPRKWRHQRFPKPRRCSYLWTV